MKIKEQIRLSKISLKSRKKTTRSTVRGISFGLIFLMPLIFLALGINFNVKKIINENPSALYANISIVDSDTVFESQGMEKRQKTDLYGNQYEEIINTFLLGNDKNEELSNIDSKKTYYYSLNNDSFSIYSNYEKIIGYLNINNGENIPLNTKVIDENEEYDFSRFTAIDLKKSDESEKIKEMLLPNYNQGFSENSAKEVLVSEEFLNVFNINKDDIYLNKISLKYMEENSGYNNNGQIFKDNDNDPFNEPTNIYYKEMVSFFKEFKVVGIIEKKHIGFIETYRGSTMMFTTDSLFNEDNKTYSPVFTKSSDIDQSMKGFIATYNFDNEEKTYWEDNYLRIGIGAFNNYEIYMKNDEIYITNKLDITFENNSYEDLDKTINKLANIFNDTINSNTNKSAFKNSVGSAIYNNFQMIYTIFLYATIILLSVGGIIFFSSMVNLFNTIMHSVDSRKNYLGVMRAMGEKSREIPKLYMIETLVIFFRAMIWITIFGGGLCFLSLYGINSAFTFMEKYLDVAIKISPIFIAYTYVIVILVLLLFGFIFSYSNSRKVSRKAIMEVLEG